MVMVKKHKYSWDELVTLEPRLDLLLKEAQSVKDDKTKDVFCANRIWYGDGSRNGLKQKMSKLVGWFSEKDDPILRSPAAYNLAYDTIYNALPDCRHPATFC